MRPLIPLQKILKTGDERALRRTLHFFQDKVNTFTQMIPWPALAASYQKDVDALLNRLGSIHESQDRQSPSRSSSARRNAGTDAPVDRRTEPSDAPD